MNIYSVTPQMERHMSSIELFGSDSSMMHSLEEEETANKFLDGKIKDFDDTFVYGELNEAEVEEPVEELPPEEEETLIKMALEDIVSKLSPEPTIKVIKVNRKKLVKKVKIEVEKKDKPVARLIMKGEHHGGFFNGVF
jgi:hypothetical protein